METITHSLFFAMADILAGGQAVVLKHCSLSLVLLNLKWTKVQSHRSYLLRDRFIRSYLPILKQDA